ncbi:homoserine kinase [bacterium]|nr:homoserine kinase [bacterium]
MKPTPAPMPVGTRCRVRVPASTSNLGPAFDSVGCAVSLFNTFTFEVQHPGTEPLVELSGERSAGIPASPRNLALTIARGFYERVGVAPPVLGLRAEIDIPSARGLGSSSTAIVAGIVAANALLGGIMNTAELLDVAVELEGHPDNVAPALLGGMVISASESRPLAYQRIAVHHDVSFVFVVPDYEVRTADARRVLPSTISLKDGIYNASRSPLMVLAMLTGDLSAFPGCLDDRFHQPWRKPLFRHYDELSNAATKAGAAGFCVSGAGPTMLAICRRERRDAVIGGLARALGTLGLGGFVEELTPTASATTADITPA